MTHLDITHHVVEKGQGKPLILLHGNGESSHYFKDQIDVFAQNYHVFALDTRGHGQTPRGEKPFTLMQFSEDLKAFCESKGLTAINILGFSDGGNIAMIFASHYPEMVEKLVLNGANYNPSGIKAIYKMPMNAVYAVSSLLRGLNKKAKQTYELFRLMIKEPYLTSADLRKLTMPTLVIAGTNDIITDDHTQRLAQHLPHSQLVILEGGHTIANEKPEEFNQIVLQFLQQSH